MAKYIDCDYLASKLENHYRDRRDVAFSLDNVLFILKKCPTADVVEVVHCSQCGKWNKQICKHHGLKTEYYDFCSYGKRKEGTEE